MSIDRDRFLELQYTALRAEIETAKDNMFKLVVGGAAVIPTAQSLADTYSIGTITLALPLIVVVLVLLFLAEWNIKGQTLRDRPRLPESKGPPIIQLSKLVLKDGR